MEQKKWRERINLVIGKEKTNMVLENEWKQRMEGQFYQKGERKGGKN